MQCAYDLEEQRVIEWARRFGYRSLLLQAPDGLKACARRLAESLASKGFDVVLSASHCWGGCDVALNEVKRAGCEALVHIGHHGPVRFKPPRSVLFVPGRSLIDLEEVAAKAASKLVEEGIRTVGVVASVQHVHALSSVVRKLGEQGLRALTSRSPDPFMQEGLIVGCDQRAAENLSKAVDAFLVIAGGVFHAIGVALATGVKTYAVDPYASSIRDVDREVKKVIALRLSHLSLALEARNATLVVSLKPGQRLTARQFRILWEVLKSKGYKVDVVAFDDVSREALENFGGSSLYVNLACPRLATDDHHLFPGPVVNPSELLAVLKGGIEAYTPSLSVTWWRSSRTSPSGAERPPPS
ncbi:MAG: diphthamide biosynthesis enzyme Dph2 [Thermofilaceae archaeon]